LKKVEGSPPDAELLASGCAAMILGVMAPELGSGRKKDDSNVWIRSTGLPACGW